MDRNQDSNDKKRQYPGAGEKLAKYIKIHQFRIKTYADLCCIKQTSISRKAISNKNQ